MATRLNVFDLETSMTDIGTSIYQSTTFLSRVYQEVDCLSVLIQEAVSMMLAEPELQAFAKVGAGLESKNRWIVNKRKAAQGHLCSVKLQPDSLAKYAATFLVCLAQSPA